MRNKAYSVSSIPFKLEKKEDAGIFTVTCEEE
jgi:hypothetical protein